LGDLVKKVRIALLCPILDDPTSWYRGIGPWDTLCKENDWQLTFPTALTWAALKGVDVLVLQRPALPEHFGMLVLAKNMGVRVIVDFDDDNLSVPRDNPTYPQYCQMPIKEAILNLARHCDVLTVTTQFLKEKYGIYNKNTVIIPNALDNELLKRRQLLTGDRENKFVWRGNGSQVKNLSTVSQCILNVNKKYPDYRFVFFGFEPFDLTEQLKNHECPPAMPLADYFNALCHFHGKCLIYPLHYQDHSQARSHISWIEGTYANMAVLAYKNAEFTRPGCLNYSSLTEFQDTLEAIIRNEVDIQFHVEQSWNEIQEKYLLSHTNKKRFEIVQALL
jgi:glycosyltransferase involved in cell wall biosynthesis